MKKNKYHIIILMIVILISVSGCSLSTGNKSLEVSTMQIYEGDITKDIEVSGFISSNQIETIPVEAGREVLKTHIKEGDFVEKNQLLAEMDTKDLKLSLRKSQVSKEDLTAQINNLKADKNTTSLLSNALSRNKEEYEIVSQDLTVANEDLEKAKILYDESAISKVEYDNYIFQVNRLNSNLKKAELSINDATINLNNTITQRDQSISSLNRQIQSLNIDIESLNNYIEDSKIYSSISGFVTDFPLEELQKILPGSNITIYGNESYILEALVSQDDAVLINEGMKSDVMIDGISTVYEGKVLNISKVATTEKNSTNPKVEVKILLNNPDDSISFGYEGKANIIIESLKDIMVLKNECIKMEDGKTFVFVVDGNKAKKVYIETGISDDYITHIKDGLSQDDNVIVNPPVDLVEGSSIKIVN